MIGIQQLSKKYGAKTVLQEINLQFEAGKVYGIAGENGAGKTTLFRCIAGLESYEGQIISSLPDIKSQLGYLPTNPVMLSHITGWEYLKLLCTARSIHDEAFEYRNIFDLPLQQYASNYSTGMKKKLALLGILLQRNEVFILDEPFNGVDLQSNLMITEIIAALKTNGKIVLIASHIFSTLRDNCDEIYLLRAGVIEKKVTRESYDELENDMKNFVLGDSLERLGL